MPLPCYFIDSSPALLAASEEGKEICENITFLGGCGVKMVEGIKIAYLSGVYSESTYEIKDIDDHFVAKHYTKKAVEKLSKEAKDGVDLLVTQEWPTDYWRALYVFDIYDFSLL